MLPRSSVVPAGGGCRSRGPSRTSSETSLARCGSKPASSSCSLGLVAAAGPRPTAPAPSPGPVGDGERHRRALVGASCRGRGSCAATRSRSTSALTTCTMSTSKPRVLERSARRSPTSLPTTSGTASCSGREQQVAAPTRDRRRSARARSAATATSGCRPAAPPRRPARRRGGGADHRPLPASARGRLERGDELVGVCEARGGSFSSARSTTASSAGGIAGLSSRGGTRRLGDLLERDR